MSKRQALGSRGHGDLIRRAVEAAPSVSMAQLREVTGLTRPGVLYHLNAFIEIGEVEYVGPRRGRSVRYQAAYDKRWVRSVEPGMAEHVLWSEMEGDILNPDMTEEARSTHSYVFGEMINNVIDHASATSLTVLHRTRGGSTWVSVKDDGVGIFEHIAASEGLPDGFSSIRKLQSGAFTTDPEAHTGQGLFFSSRSVDEFSVGSGGLSWITNNIVGDQTVRHVGTLGSGTSVSWRLQDTTSRSLAGLFDYFSIAGDDEVAEFVVTSIAVSASEGDALLLTRSEARELLDGKERFQVVILDFTGVTNVGQGFADEAFRVFPTEHEGVTVVAVNAIPAVSWFVDQAQEKLRRSKT